MALYVAVCVGYRCDLTRMVQVHAILALDYTVGYDANEMNRVHPLARVGVGTQAGVQPWAVRSGEPHSFSSPARLSPPREAVRWHEGHDVIVPAWLWTGPWMYAL